MLIETGFQEVECEEALDQCDGDENLALTYLMGL